MDLYEQRARQLDDAQQKRFRVVYKGDLDSFWNEYEVKIYQEIVRLFRKSKTYEGENS